VERFKTGIDDYLAVLDAQREYYSGRQLIAARLDRGRNTVALYRALENWSDTPERVPSP
jgi:multidrug efflux system outer membrane protein